MSMAERSSLGIALVALTVSILGVVAVQDSVAAASIFVVNATDDADDGTCNVAHCSLREAIKAANAVAGLDEIGFAIPGDGPHTIEPSSALPSITDAVVIDGYSQAGASENTAASPDGLTTVLMIILEGSSAGPNASGLEVIGGSSTIRGMAISNFNGSGIRLMSLAGNTVTGNFIGTDVTGTTDLGNDLSGVRIGGSGGHQVGGSSPSERNLISGNDFSGVFIITAADNVVQGNLIGTDVTGSRALGNSGGGIWITFEASDNMIGGMSPFEGNVIAHGKAGGNGVMVYTGSRNAILSNSIFGNAGLGIDIEGTSQGVTPNDAGDRDSGANGIQNFPILTKVLHDVSTVEGTLSSRPESDFRVEVFANAGCDASGHGEGSAFIGAMNVSTDGVGDTSFEIAVAGVPSGTTHITATATDSDNNTSEFSACAQPERATVGLVDTTQGLWHLRNSLGETTSFYFGNPADLPVSGDWNGDGVSTPGLYRQSDGFFYSRGSNTQGPADRECFAGNPSDIPIAGDWDGDGDDNLGLYRPSEQRFFLFTSTCIGQPMGAAEVSFLFGNPGDKPVAGDWDGDGVDEIGLHRESTGFFYWRNTLDTGVASDEIYFGNPADRFVAGDWGEVDGIDTPAVFRPANLTFYFRHALTQGTADDQFTWTGAGQSWLPVGGLFGLD